jgi:hypothetical protein
MISSRWDSILRSTGYSGVDIEVKDFPWDECHNESMMISTATDTSEGHTLHLENVREELILIVAACSDPAAFALANGISRKINTVLRARCVIGSLRALATSSVKGFTRFILIEGQRESLLPPSSAKDFEALKSILTSATQLIWVTPQRDCVL